MAIAMRHSLAVRALKLRGDEQVLEIGCGHGVATRLVLEHLTRGHMTALDRSDKMIAALRASLPPTESRLTLIAQALEDVDWAGRTFDVILAINVDFNLRLGDRWAPILRSVLRPNGRLVLAFEAPAGSGKSAAFARLSGHKLNSVGFEVGPAQNEGEVALVTARLR